MNKDINDKLILELFYHNNKGVDVKLLNNIINYPFLFSKDFIDYLNNRFSDSESLHETLKRLKLNVLEKPKCKYCKTNPVTFIGKDSQMFTEFCSCSCKSKYDTLKRHLKREAEYGLPHNELMSNKYKRRHLYKEYSDAITPKYDYNIKNERYDNILVNAICTDDKIVTKRIYNGQIENILQNYKNIYDYICNRFCDSNSFRESLFRLYSLFKKNLNCPLEHIERKPLCPICNKNYVAFRFQQDRPYGYTCSTKCGFEYSNENRKKTNIEKFGVDNPFGNKEIIDKIKNTWMEKYGVDNPGKSKEVKEKYLDTMNERYNLNVDKNGLTFKEYQNKVWSALISSEETQKRMHDTKKKNHSFNYSKPEIELFNKLKEIYPDIIHQYRDSIRYPYNCDYYIPSLDLFIEYQGYRGHNEHPFDPNNEDDIKALDKFINRNNELKQKTGRTNTLYDRIIHVWTISDPLKRETAKQNNLNFIEIWPDWSDEKILEEIKAYER